MDRTTLERHLAVAEGHVALGEQHTAHQHQRVAELKRDGHATAVAERLLAEFEQSLALHIEHRDRLRRELAEPTATPQPI